MRSRSAESTYYFKRTPSQDIYGVVLGLNHQIHSEACHNLYAEHVFDFDMDIESILPFLKDLTPVAILSMRRMRLVKRSLPYTKDFDRCEWRNACTFIRDSMRNGTMGLKHLDLGVYGGTPSLANKPALHWNQRHTYSKSDFVTIFKFGEMAEDMEWVKHDIEIQGLQALNVKAILEHCPIPGSQSMAFFVNFSASIEKGFTEYLKSLMFAQTS